MTFFIKAILSALFVITVAVVVAWSRFRESQKKRQIRIRNFRTSRLPKVKSSNPNQLDQRRQEIILRGKSSLNDKRPSGWVLTEPSGVIRRRNKNPNSVTFHPSVPKPSPTPTRIVHNASVYNASAQGQLRHAQQDLDVSIPRVSSDGEDDTYFDIHSKEEEGEQNREGYEGYNGEHNDNIRLPPPSPLIRETNIVIDPFGYDQQESDEEPTNKHTLRNEEELPRGKTPTFNFNFVSSPLHHDRTGRYRKGEVKQAEQVAPAPTPSPPPTMLQDDHSSSLKSCLKIDRAQSLDTIVTPFKSGYSLLDALIKKKNKNVHAYRNIFDGKQGEKRTEDHSDDPVPLLMSDPPSPNYTGRYSHRSMDVLPILRQRSRSGESSVSENSDQSSGSPHQSDAYKYLRMPPKDHKQAAYLNPYGDYHHPCNPAPPTSTDLPLPPSLLLSESQSSLSTSPRMPPTLDTPTEHTNYNNTDTISNSNSFNYHEHPDSGVRMRKHKNSNYKQQQQQGVNASPSPYGGYATSTPEADSRGDLHMSWPHASPTRPTSSSSSTFYDQHEYKREREELSDETEAIIEDDDDEMDDEAPYAVSPFQLSYAQNPSLHKKRNSDEIRTKFQSYQKHSRSGSESTEDQRPEEQRLDVSISNEEALTSSPSPFLKQSSTTDKMLRLSEERSRNRDVLIGDSYEEFDHLLDGVDLHDWNERFQRIMTTIRKFNTNTTIALQIKANRALIHLAQDFIYASSTYGKIIISEVYSAEKTIRPIRRLGGQLGGQKYIVQNILFKFAVEDESGLYSDYAAAKVAGHELKGIINYFNCNIEDLCLPLMSLVDYRGFRLIAMSILPIQGSETIIYGSDDYGMTIYNKNKEMETLLQRAAKIINIKEHRCGMHPQSSHALSSPADLEGHIGTDGRFYLLDFSRVLPPETPAKGIHNAHLFRLLRPEYLKKYHTPLCSDAFSAFIARHNYKVDNREVVEATNYSLNVLIPAFAPELTLMMLEARDKGELESFRLTEAIHRQGINVRYTGVLRKFVMELDCRTFLLVEMSARIVKNKLRKLLRKKMKELKVPLEEPYRRLVISYLNLVLGDSEPSEDYWNYSIKRAIQRTFVQGMSEQESNVAHSLKSSLSNFSIDKIDGKLLLFQRLQKMTGLRFTNRINEEFTKNPNNWAPRGAEPLDETDLEDIGLRVKHMNIISHAQGFVLQMKGAGTWTHDPVAAERFYNMAITKYEEALDTNPNDYQALIRCAEIVMQFIEGHAKGVAAMKFNIDKTQVQYANMLFQRAITANPRDSYGLYRYAQFLDKCNMREEAEEMFLRSLEADPENVACLQEYGNFLTENATHEKAEQFYVLGSELAQKYSIH